MLRDRCSKAGTWGICEQCYWCWKWQYGLVRPDPITPRGLCYNCFKLFEPPWYPNNRQRASLYLAAMWRSHEVLNQIADVVASFSADPYVP